MHNGNILYTVSQRCLLLSNFMTWETPLRQCLQCNYLLSYCVLQFPASSAPPPVQRPGAVPQAQVSHVQDGERPHAEVTMEIRAVNDFSRSFTVPREGFS